MAGEGQSLGKKAELTLVDMREFGKGFLRPGVVAPSAKQRWNKSGQGWTVNFEIDGRSGANDRV